jgi:hypothetical protein
MRLLTYFDCKISIYTRSQRVLAFCECQSCRNSRANKARARYGKPWTCVSSRSFSPFEHIFSLNGDHQWANYAYADRAREKARVTKRVREEDREKERSDLVNKKRKIEKAWSQQTQRKESKVVRQEKKQRKKAFLKTQRPQAASQGDNDDEEAEELSTLEKVAKKVKRGKAPKADLDIVFAFD